MDELGLIRGAQAPSVRIIGGGLTGILAAFEAHRLGCRRIELHERFDQLGGSAWPRRDHGLELRPERLYFGQAGDPARALLEANGLAFEDFENRFGSVSPAPGGDLVFTHDFEGPALRTRKLDLGPVTGDSLADRIRAYPHDIAQQLTRYSQWALGAWLDEVSAEAAMPLGIKRVHATQIETCELARAKRADPVYDGMYGIPRALWGRLQNLTASLPAEGFQTFFQRCRAALERLGVTIHTASMVSPQRAFAAREAGELVVWAADPTPLFSPLDLEPPRRLAKSLVSYIFKARYAGPLPFHVRNFTAEGAVFRIHLYECRGQALLSAECVAEVSDSDLRREVHRLMSGFGGASLHLDETLSIQIEPRWGQHSVDAARKLSNLHGALARSQGASFVAGAWEAQNPSASLAEISVSLVRALDLQQAEAVAA
ncbi:flagellin modification protein FlmF [Phenylobacterium sp.]|uniref:flavin monoamine oxidase family protein n=1 Tax=Phenylobacterium sp. TaxID=1871053 RepID=UPI003BAA506F